MVDFRRVAGEGEEEEEEKEDWLSSLKLGQFREESDARTVY